MINVCCFKSVSCRVTDVENLWIQEGKAEGRDKLGDWD